ncbi:bifunctional peptidase and (3S)-lysyl hydroxylase JMJD7-like [Artemia franciscana]|uniref:bifunctional peptidase and (3S)-lysyl hydroxylase JMJD7-like n=1 Tax=Artemia franciscana TaxID=6661 RepID=UPI0032DB06E9
MDQEENAKITSSFESLSRESKELYLHSCVSETEVEPTALQFMKKCVSPNLPLIIREGCKYWPATSKWSHEYLRSVIGNKFVTVAVTPNGYADAIREGQFVLPEERKIKFSDFLDIIENPDKTNGVYYVQKQDSSLVKEFQEIAEDVPKEIVFASLALEKKPDAINFWMGDKRAVTSMHKDPFENIYGVIKGHKDFILIPPTDLPWIPYKTVPQAVYKETTGQFEIVSLEDSDPIPWIDIDPLNPDVEKYPKFKNAHMLRCRVHAGDLLYLPSMWFHHVRQTQGCIAVNYWYDMDYDIKYAYYTMLETLCTGKPPEDYIEPL